MILIKHYLQRILSQSTSNSPEPGKSNEGLSGALHHHHRTVIPFCFCAIKENSMPCILTLDDTKYSEDDQVLNCGENKINPMSVLVAENCRDNENWKVICAAIGNHNVIINDANKVVIEIIK